MKNNPINGVALMGEIEGVVQGHRDGHGFVVGESGRNEVYLAPTEMQSVLHKDRVKVRVVRYDRKGRPEGRILEILARQKAPIIGRLLHEDGGWLVAPEDKRYGRDILVPHKGIANAKLGQIVVVELVETPSLHAQPIGRVIEVLGEVDDPGMEIEIAVRKYGVPHQFSQAALTQADKLPEKIRVVDRTGRLDLTDVELVTIDGEDARDFDDAVYCEPAKVGRTQGWRLVVAIADVSHYVQPGTALNQEAYERATSVYFPRRVIPMLPEKLSNGLCSLKPNVDRLAMVCDMLITAQGEVRAYQFFPAVICSHARLTYTEVAAVLANTAGPEAARYAKLVPHLLNLHAVYRALLKERAQRGAMDFETTETQIICDENGRIDNIVPRVRTEAHRLIEEAMLAANVCTADFIQRAKHPALYRVHEGPTPERLNVLQNYLKTLGLPNPLGENPQPAAFQALALATKNRSDVAQIHMMLLRAMQQAIYTPVNSGHFGLAYEAYTHFTSPIRRYPDLLVHRVIKALLAKSRYALDASIVAEHDHKEASVKKLNRKSSTPELAVWEQVGLQCSTNERRADEASRDVEAWLKCMFMHARLGEEYTGTVSAVTPFGLFVQLDNLYIEGLVHITELGGEYYRFDEARQELWGERSGMRYAIGNRLRVQVSRVDLESRKIDFRLLREGGASGPYAGKGALAKPPKSLLSSQQELSAIQQIDRGVKAAQARLGKAAKGGSDKTPSRKSMGLNKKKAGKATASTSRAGRHHK